ncbi:P-loop containing nucleoside triphosphate hydrolase protein, partial [Cristinia sonorae]
LHPVSNTVVHPSRLKDLRVFLHDSNASFTSPAQATLLELIVDGRSHLLAVVGTGIGKTTLIMMVAKMYASTRTVIVVLPLLSLHNQMRSRALLAGLKASKFSPDEEFDRYANIVTVQIEHLDSPRFNECLISRQGLYRIFCDEIHKALTDVHYRQAFLHLSSLNLLSTQIVALTATMPPHLVPALSSLTGVTWRVLRSPTQRKELILEMRHHEHPIQAAFEYLRDEVLGSYTKEDRAIVFAVSLADAEDLASKLGSKPYHSKADWQVVQDFERGTHNVLVTTTALGVGYDNAHVRHVIHVLATYSLFDHDQQIGRAGRDGLPAVAISFFPLSMNPPTKKASYDLGQDALYQWATHPNQCLRIILSRFMDGVATTCMLLQDAQLCQSCRKEMNRPPPSRTVSLPPPHTLPANPPPAAATPL